jgi:hypothetical protein
MLVSRTGKFRPVANLGRFRPGDVCKRVEAAIEFEFNASVEFPQAWKRLSLRPPSAAKGDSL